MDGQGRDGSFQINRLNFVY